MKSWLKRRLLDPLLALLRQGMAPRRLALCVAIAIMVGNIPILGVSTIICTLIALLFGLNLAAMQLVQASMAPTQLLLIIPFVRLGEWIVRAPPQVVSIKAGFALLSQGVWQAIVVLRDAIFHAALSWAIVAPFCVYVLQLLLTPMFERMAAQVRRQPATRTHDLADATIGARPVAGFPGALRDSPPAKSAVAGRKPRRR